MRRDLAQLAIRRADAGGPLRVWRRLPYQVPPSWDWREWWFFGGRGAGKTDGMSEWVHEHVHGPPCDRRWKGGHCGFIVGPSFNVLRRAVLEGVSGLRVRDSSVRWVDNEIRWGCGVRAYAVSGGSVKDADAIEGPAACFAAFEEMRHIRELERCLIGARLSCRLGARKIVGASTPDRRLRPLLDGPSTAVSRAAMDDNPFLEPGFVDQFAGLRGTRLGRQLLDGEFLDDVSGALWRSSWIKVGVPPRGFRSVAVAFDPGGDEDGSDEMGIVVVGLARDGMLWVLQDLSGRWPVADTVRHCWDAVYRFGADVLLVETNNGGTPWLAHLRDTSAQTGVRPEIVEGVWHDVGKRARFEPVARLYEPGLGPVGARIQHAGWFDELTHQMTTWTGGQFDLSDPVGVPRVEPSPDRVDAMCMAVTWLVETVAGVESYRGLFDPEREVQE